MVLDNRSGLIWAYLTVAYATLFFSAIFHWETRATARPIYQARRRGATLLEIQISDSGESGGGGGWWSQGQCEARVSSPRRMTD
jgi:hypothetical protein